MIWVDNSKLKELSMFSWYVNIMGYAANDSKPRKLMHRHILGYPKKGVDHINGNKLDNRRKNLRVCTQSQNMANSPKRTTNRSGFKGVSWNKRYGKWEAYLTKDYKRVFLGYFDDIREAAKAYNTRAKKEFRAFANLNKL